jgi:hypothetical protein
MKTFILPALLAAALVACTPAAETPAEAPAAPAEQTEPVPEVAPEPAAPVSDLDVAFELGFTEYALMRLAELGETVTISAMYYGEPLPEVAKTMTEADGPFYVVGTYETIVDPVDQTISVSGAGVDTAKLVNLTGAPVVNVNIFTSRTKHPENIITCTLIDGEVAELRAKPPATLCEMLDAN